MPDFHAMLRSIAFLESETKVYLVSIGLGPATAQTLVRRSGLSRPATNAAIDSLMSKGLMTSHRQGKRSLYSAESGARLLAYAESQSRAFGTKLKELSESLEDLEMLRKGERPTVKFFEGIEGLKAILLDIARSDASSTEEIANMDAIRKVLSETEIAPVQGILAKRKTKGRALLLGTVKKVRPGVEAKSLPSKEFGFYGDIVIYGDKVAMVTFKDKVVGAVIENGILADTLKALFALAWKGAGEYPKIKD